MQAVRPLPILQPEFAQARALVKLRTAEEAIRRKNPEDADRDVAESEKDVRLSLSVSPSDSFLWMMLYGVETMRKGFDRNSINMLEQSYTAAPLEGWIAVRRNRVSLAVFPFLSEAMQKLVLSEFAGMVSSDFIEDAAFNLINVGWPHRDRLLAGLEQVDLVERKALAKRLAREALNVTVPGAEIEERPWR